MSDATGEVKHEAKAGNKAEDGRLGADGRARDSS